MIHPTILAIAGVIALIVALIVPSGTIREWGFLLTGMLFICTAVVVNEVRRKK